MWKATLVHGNDDVQTRTERLMADLIEWADSICSGLPCSGVKGMKAMWTFEREDTAQFGTNYHYLVLEQVDADE